MIDDVKVSNLVNMLSDCNAVRLHPELRYKHIMTWDYHGSYHAIMVVSNDD